MYGLSELIIAFVILWCIPFTRNIIKSIFYFIINYSHYLLSEISFTTKHYHNNNQSNNLLTRQQYRNLMNNYTDNDYEDDDSDSSDYGPKTWTEDSNINLNSNSNDNQFVSYLDDESSDYNQDGPFKDPCVGTYLNRKNELHYAYKFQYLDNGIRHYYYLDTEKDMRFISEDNIDIYTYN